MEIDLNQLPIPDWDLECPECRYPLRGLPSHRCPECGCAFEVADLVHSWTRLRPPHFTGQELPVPDFDLPCPRCDASLNGAPTHACPACGADTQRLFEPPRGEWTSLLLPHSGGVASQHLALVFLQEYVPHRLEPVENIGVPYRGNRLREETVHIRSEFYFEALWLLAQERRRVQTDGEVARTRTRQCPACGEENPGNFAVCWNCGAAL